MLIDEIQYATELFSYIKMTMDRSKQKGDFWLTGSQVFHLMNNVSKSLAGRVGIVNLLGLSDAEIYQEPSEPFCTDVQHLMSRLSTRSPKELNVIYRDGVLSLIEIKKSASPGKTAIKNFQVLEPATHEKTFTVGSAGS